MDNKQMVIPGLVSTVIPTFNRPELMTEAVRSVLQQDYRPIEVIIVDDGSTDNTQYVCTQLERQHAPIIKVVRKQNSGAGLSREAGRLIASGEFIQYLDSDDLLLPDKFSASVELMKQRLDVGAVYGWIRFQREDGTELEKPYKCSGEKRTTLFPWLLADRWWNTNAPLWRRSVCDQIGPWSDLRWSQDWEYDARAAALGIQLGYLPQYVTVQRQHAGARQTSSADWTKPERVHNRQRFFQLMWQHAQRSDIQPTDPHQKHFSRWAFATARIAASAGMGDAADDLMEIAEQSAAGQAEVRRGFRLFRMASSTLGWKAAAAIFATIEKVKRPGRMTLKESFVR